MDRGEASCMIKCHPVDPPIHKLDYRSGPSVLPPPNDAIGLSRSGTAGFETATRFARLATLAQVAAYVWIFLNLRARSPFDVVIALPVLAIAGVVGAVCSARVLSRSGRAQRPGRYVALAILGLAVSFLTLVFFACVFLVPMFLSVS
jgi:hypothetical protein